MAASTKKIRFLADAAYPQSGPDGRPDPKLSRHYKAGETYEIDNSAGHADRWLNRGLAVEEVAAESPAPAKKAEPAKKPEAGNKADK